MPRSQIDYRIHLLRVQGVAVWRLAGWGTLFIVAASIVGGIPPRAANGAERGAKPEQKLATDGVDQPAGRTEARLALKPSLPDRRTSTTPAETASLSTVDVSIREALRRINDCKLRFSKVNDYSCDFYKRERIGGKLTPLHVMSMKERTKPKSIYFKFKQPYQGREAIYVKGRNNGNVLAHDVGFTKLLAGTMALDPNGSRAMENNRHPITDAGIGALIDTVHDRWSRELNAKHSVINHVQDIQVGPHDSVVMVESIHPVRDPEFLFHKVRLYINEENGLPIRFEAYDYPKTPQAEPELLEEYTYLNLKLNVGLKEIDFDPANEQYSFGRF